ncbi:Cys-Gln thioester bond-forming surface protein [Blautia sp. MSK17_66]|uniref:thioester domain-containing protein n=1 Tax=Blautia TaxID=572511 RepID=UPI001FC80436|nr:MULTISPECIES: thioester domain-containing protein [Blautia]MCB5550056.1 Cys-Gln thioester bond-forming surface protein [Blautia sp. MSK17_66]NSK01733.1 Cys-Gln thioester bond-forming surface protein [Blautia obeum]
MKIPKLFKKAAAFVMAAVTALSIMPATAFAAGDIGTISFSHTYDSNGNAMRYNSSANIGGYTAGGTGNYKYRMFVDGENAFCIQPGVPLKTGNTLKKASSDTWNALSANQKKAVGLALLYGYQGNRNNLSGSDDEKWLATQTLVWEFVTGCREATGSYNQTSTTVYSLHFGSNYANSGARAVYDQIVAMLREHNTIPSFMSGGKNDITKELAYKDGKYSITLTDSNGVLSDYSFSSSDSNVSVSKSGNKLTIRSTVAISGSVRITAKRNNVPTVSSSAKLIAYGDPNLQDLVTGVENADTVSAYINIETPTGTIALKKTSEDGVVEGISFIIKGDNFNKTVKTGKDGSVSVEGLFPGTYTVTEQSIDRYEPQKTQTVTLIGGKTSTVTFSNTLKRGSLEIVKTSEDNLVEGMKFHLYGTSLSGLPVDEYAVTDKNGLAKFENVLISGDTPYVVEEVDTAVRYVVPASQTAPIEWNKVTKRSFDNVLKKFQVTVTKTDAETGSPQGDASLAGAVYGIYKGEELIDTYTTDENGQFTTKYYICDNDWTVREISPSEGYLLDTAIHKVGAEPELYTVELNSTASLASAGWRWGADIINGIVNGIRSCIGAVANAVTDVANTIRSHLHFSVPDEGPLTDFESWMPDFMSGLAEGIEKSRGMVKAAVNSVAADMVISPQMAVADSGVMTGTGTSGGADLTAGIVAALKDVLGDQKEQQGDLVIPVYLGNQLLDEVIVTAQQRMSLRSGGR